MKWIVLVLLKDGKFDCVLEGKIYQSHSDAVDAIAVAEKEDRDNGWDYSYRAMALTDK